MQNWLPVTWHGAKPVPDTGGFLPVEEPGYTRCLYCTKLVTSTKYRYDFPQRGPDYLGYLCTRVLLWNSSLLRNS